jgi:cytochrome c peroxidase
MAYKLFALICLFSFVLISCNGKKDAPKEGMSEISPVIESEILAKAKTIFGVLPDKMPGSETDTPDLIALGKKLYNETKLSATGTQSCATCHDLTKGGVDNKPTSPGAKDGLSGTRNSPTVLNAGYQFVQFWDGRAKDLVEQAKGPILNPVEMAMKTDKDVEKAIAAIPEYKDMFAKAFPGEKNPVTYDNLAKAIAAFERTLISKSRYDQWLAGNKAALTPEEKMGMKHFFDANCTICHIGPLLGGGMYQKMGLVKPYADTKDMGRFDVTKVESDKYMFKVAQLRNIAITGPYFHDGKAVTLEEAIKTMGDIQLGKALSPMEIEHIAAFLKALTDVDLEKTLAKK